MEKYTKQFEKLENSAVKMTLTFSAAAVDEAYKADLNKYAKKLVINGFRQGKAPIAVIENKYGETILSETFTNMLDETVQEIFTPKEGKEAVAKEFEPIDSRALDLVNENEIFPIKKGQDVVCEVKYDVYPQFELGQYTGLKVEYTADDYDEKDEQQEIENIRKRNAMIQEKKDGEVAVGDIVTVDIVEMLDETAEKADSKTEDYTFTVSETPTAPYNFDKDIVGMKSSEEKIIKGEEAGMIWKVTLKKIKVSVLPELDDDFAQDVSEAYKTMDDMKKAIHEKLFNEYNKRVEAVKVDAALDTVAKATTIAVPKMMIDNYIEEKWYGFVQNFTQNGQRSFADTEKYLSSMGITRESYLSTMDGKFADENLLNIKKSLVLEKIEEVEKTEETDEKKIEEFIEKNHIDLKQYGEAYEPMMKDQIKSQLGKDNAISFIMKNNEFVKVEAPKAEEPKAPKAKTSKAKAAKAAEPKAEAEKAE